MRTKTRSRAVLGVLVAVLAVPVVGAERQGAAGVTRDMQGWRDVAWGSTPAQVEASIGRSLGQPKKGEDGRTYYRIPDFGIGAWVTNLVVIFSGSDRLGLSSVTINFRKDAEFKPVADELAARYGPPTSSKRESLADGTQVQEAAWLFPSTELTCRWRGVWGIVVYQPRSKGPSRP